MNAQFPLTDLILRDQIQKLPNQRTEIIKHLHHADFASRRRISRRRGGCKIGVWLCGRDVVDGLAGHGVGDDVALFADPADDAVVVDELEELGVGFHFGAREHDAVGGLVGVFHGGVDVELFEHLRADDGFDAVGGEEDVYFHGVGGAVPWFGYEGGFWCPGGDAVAGCGEEELDGWFALAAGVERACQGRPMAYHVWVAVLLTDIGEQYMT